MAPTNLTKKLSCTNSVTYINNLTLKRYNFPLGETKLSI